MASNPFFSGRIPPELHQQIEKYCQETGESKTEVLIKALSAYLNFPIIIPQKNFIAAIPEVTKEMFEELEKRIKILEENNSNKATSNKNIRVENNDSNHENNVISDNGVETKINLEETHPSYRAILSSEVSEKTNIPNRQISRLAGRAVEKLKQQGKTLEIKKILENPIEVTQKEAIKVNGYPYKLFYLGENLKEKPLWNLLPDDNASYQLVIDEDNKENTKEEIVNSPAQELVEKSADEQI
jgi:transcriptional regulator